MLQRLKSQSTMLTHFIREAMWIELMGGDEAVGLA
jgi:hypothetical protein